MKKHIILLSAAGLLFSSCGVYTKYKPATEVPDGLYGEEMAAFTESLAGSPAATEDSLDLGLGGMDWHELFTDPHLQALIGQGLQNNTDYQSAQLRVEEAEATLLSAKLAFLPSLLPVGSWMFSVACAMPRNSRRRSMRRVRTIARPCVPSSLPG